MGKLELPKDGDNDTKSSTTLSPELEIQGQEIVPQTRKAISAHYRAVNGRCAVDLDSLGLPIPKMESLAILESIGFKVLPVDLIALARQCIKSSIYRRSARPSEAPSVVDCTSLMKWLYGQRGIWLPRRSIQQREYGQTVDLDQTRAGDLIFLSGRIDYFIDDPANGVGHVAMATGENTVIHAANKKLGVVECPLTELVNESKFRGARRYIPADREILTLLTPPEREVETEDDIKWILLQTLPKRQVP